MSENLFPELSSVVDDVTEHAGEGKDVAENDNTENGGDTEEGDPNVINVFQGDVTVIESMCMNCQENGETKLLFTKIPFFREIIISSFQCEHCDFSNNEVQFGGEIKEKGVKYVFTVQTPEDLNRQV